MTLKIGSMACDNLTVNEMAIDMIKFIAGDNEPWHVMCNCCWVLTREFVAQIIQWTNDVILEGNCDELLEMLQNKDIVNENSVWYNADNVDYMMLNSCLVNAFIEAYINKSKTIKIVRIEEK